MKRRFWIGIIFICIILINSCSKDISTTTTTTTTTSSVDCTSVAKSFASDVNPIIQGSCSGGSCHGSGTNNGPGPLTDYSQISAAKNSISSAVSSGSMPKNGKLTASQKNSIICWVNAGGLNN